MYGPRLFFFLFVYLLAEYVYTLWNVISSKQEKDSVAYYEFYNGTERFKTPNLLNSPVYIDFSSVVYLPIKC